MRKLFAQISVFLAVFACMGFYFNWRYENSFPIPNHASLWYHKFHEAFQEFRNATTKVMIPSTKATPDFLQSTILRNNENNVNFSKSDSFRVQETSRQVLTTAKAISSKPATTTPTTFKTPVILLWNPTFPNHRWQLPNTDVCGNGCELTNNITRFNESDAVVFWMEKTTSEVKNHPYMRYRRPDQAFAWWCGESAWTTNNFHRRNLHGYENFFNWSMHYRSDSDVINALMPHSARDWFLHRVGRANESSYKELKLVTSEKEFDVMFEKLLQTKKKGAAWVVSDCDLMKGAKARMEFGKRIETEGEYKFDMFGACSKKYLPYDNDKFFEALQEYKFYFAFENTFNCKDYITEKFWYNGLYAGLVPVVLGSSKDNVKRLAPPGSYLHVEDFNNDPKLLAEFLRYLETNDTAYKEYFRWWTMPGFYPLFKIREGEVEDDHVAIWHEDFQVMGFCHLCKKLQNGDHLHTHKVIPDFWQDFYGKEEPECYQP